MPRLCFRFSFSYMHIHVYCGGYVVMIEYYISLIYNLAQPSIVTELYVIAIFDVPNCELSSTRVVLNSVCFSRENYTPCALEYVAFNIL